MKNFSIMFKKKKKKNGNYVLRKISLNLKSDKAKQATKKKSRKG